MITSSEIPRKLEELEGKVNCLAGIAMSSPDGFTYLNNEARVLLVEIAEVLRMIKNEQKDA